MDLPKVTIIDTETTGMDPLSDEIVEFAAVNLHDDRSFESLVNPGRDIPPEAMAIHHITEPMVQDSPKLGPVIEEFGDFMGKNPAPYLAAHNAKFDRNMLYGWLPKATTWICTMKCAQVLWPDAPGYSNQVLRYWLGLKPVIPEGLAPHRALYDIICTREILKVQLTQASLEQLIDWSNRPVLLKKVLFGKHKGKTWDQVDTGYLKWCLAQADMDENVHHTARYWLEKKGGYRGF